MDPGQKGWLKEYLDFRRDEFVNDSKSATLKKGRHPDESLYSVVQPTGLMYGQSITTHEEQKYAEFWNHKDRLKVLLAEVFINSALLFRDEEIKNAE